MKIFRLYLILFLGISAIACRQQQYSRLLQEAESMINGAPHQALLLLDSLKSQPLSTYNRHYRKLLQVHAAYEDYQNISWYPPLLNSARYFQKNNQPDKANWAYLYSGVIFKAHKDYDQASICLSEAKEQASFRKDSLLLFQTYYHLGDLFYLTHDLHDSEEAYRKALHYHSPAHQNNDYEMGDCLLHTGRYAEARKYYNKAEDQVLKIQDSVSMADLMLQISISYLKTRERKNAVEYVKKALLYNKKPKFRMQCHLHLSEIFLYNGQADSAAFYLSRIEPQTSGEEDLTASYYRLLSRLDEVKRDDHAALAHFKKYDEYIDRFWQEKKGNRIEKIINRYNKKKWTGKNYLLSRQRNILTVSVVCLVLFLLLVITYAGIILKRRRYKYTEACKMIETLQNFCRENDQSKDKFRSLLFNQLEISKKLTAISLNTHNPPQSFLKMYNEILGDWQQSTLNWEELYFTIDFLYDNFHQKLIKKYPDLIEKEIQVCCLLRGGFKTDEIAFITQQSTYSIYKRKTSIRKKIGMDERTDILDHLLLHIL